MLEHVLAVCVLGRLSIKEDEFPKPKITGRSIPALDGRAIEELKKWRFKPAQKDNVPVAVEIDLEVEFR